MKKSLGKTGSIYPMPVLLIASYNDDGSVDVMNAAWGTMQGPDRVALNLGVDHQTTDNIKKRGAFTVSFATAKHVSAADFVGLVSHKKDPDKFKKSGLTASKATKVDAPVIDEFPICLECEFIEYQVGENGIGVIGKIIDTLVDEDLLTDSGIAMEKADAIIFDPLSLGYYKVGERIADAFNVGKSLK